MNNSVRTPNPKRITLNSLKDWINSELERLDMSDYECYEIVRTRFTSDQYEGGAAKLYIHIMDKTENNEYFKYSTILCFYSITELRYHIKLGWNLCIKQPRITHTEYLEVDLTRY